MTMEAVRIKPMQQKHWDQVKKIYESGIATGIATFETTAPTWDKWNAGHFTFARLVAIHHNEVVGWAALSPVSNRCVYDGVAEVSIYLADTYKGKGIGKMLLKNLITISESNNIWTLQAGIFTENTPSIKLHESVGFRVIGYREKIGKLKDTWKDNYVLEKRSKIVGIK